MAHVNDNVSNCMSHIVEVKFVQVDPETLES